METALLMCRDSTLPYNAFREDYLRAVGQGHYASFEALYLDAFADFVDNLVAPGTPITLTDVAACEQHCAELADAEVGRTVSSLSGDVVRSPPPTVRPPLCPPPPRRFKETTHASEYVDDIDELLLGMKINSM